MRSSGRRRHRRTGDDRADVPAASTAPATSPQHRNFYNPEFDAKLTDYTGWSGDVPGLSFFSPTSSSSASPGGASTTASTTTWTAAAWNEHRRALARPASRESDDPQAESLQASTTRTRTRGTSTRAGTASTSCTSTTPRGRVFVRVGRQAISWGESDTIALLDVSNPFDLTLGAPGFFQDVDEARIPLWTLRSHGQAGRQLEVALEPLRRRLHGARARSTRRCRSTRSRAACRPFNPDVADPQASIAGGQARRAPGEAPRRSSTRSSSTASRRTPGRTRAGARGSPASGLPRLHRAGLVLPHLQPGAGAARSAAARLGRACSSTARSSRR